MEKARKPNGRESNLLLLQKLQTKREMPGYFAAIRENLALIAYFGSCNISWDSRGGVGHYHYDVTDPCGSGFD